VPKILTVENKSPKETYILNLSATVRRRRFSVNNYKRWNLSSSLRDNQWKGISRRQAIKRFKLKTSAGKVMAIVFCGNEGMLDRSATIHSQRYVQTLKKFKQRNNAKAPTSLRTSEATVTTGWTVLSHPPYSHDLAPSDFDLFGLLKDALRKRSFSNDDEMKQSVREQLRCFSEESYACSIRLKQRQESLLMEILCTNNLIFVRTYQLYKYISL
jgi:hypothetical protein